MLRKIARALYALLFFLTVCVPREPAQALGVYQAFDIDWQAQFKNAPLWSDAFGIDDSLPDNTAKLNAITPGSVLIANCPHGGHVKFSTWIPPSNIKIWWKHDCIMESSVVTAGLYGIQTAPFSVNVVPNDHVYFYGMRIYFPVHVQGVRAFAMYCNHCKLNYVTVDGAGFGFFRGSDFERGHITMVNVLMAPGNPGTRDFGNMPLVATSPGMQGNDYDHHMSLQAGDGRAQACQPLQTAGWGRAVGTNDKRYYKVVSVDSDSGAVLLVNLPLTLNPGDFYPCDNITFDEVSGGAREDSIIVPGNKFSRTSNVKIRGGYYSSLLSTNVLAAFGLGNIKRGPFIFDGTNMGLVTVQDRSINNYYFQAVEIAGPASWKYIRFKRINVSLPRQIRGQRAAQVTISGTTNLHWEGGSVAINNTSLFGAFSFGDNNNQTVNPYVTGAVITGLANGQAAFAANNVKGGLITGNSAAAAAGATTAVGVRLKTDSGGTHDFVATGNTLTVPVPVICAPGQGNIVDGCQ